MRHIQPMIALISAFTVMELRLRYKTTFLGFLWTLINPLVQMAIIGIALSWVIDIPQYYQFLLAGLLPWQFFSSSLTSATTVYVRERALLHKTRFPHAALPISIVLAHFVQFIVVGAFLLLVLFIVRSAPLSIIPIALGSALLLLIITSAMSVIASTLYVRMRDVRYIVHAGQFLLFYGTPILYSIAHMPMSAYPLFALNPLVLPFELIHHMLMLDNALPPAILMGNVFIMIIIIIGSIYLYTRQQPYFVDWL